MTVIDNQNLQHIAVVGTGVIGASWASFFLAQGLDVVATDPSPDAEAALRRFVDRAWPVLTQRGLAPGASPDRLEFASSLNKAVEGAQFVQENGPERLEIKRQLFAQMDEAAEPNVIIASSSSGLKMTEIQSACRNPERCVIGHPFNPPHLIPLVEVVGGAQTSRETIDRAMGFYASLGKRAIHVRKEINGHVANRLQAALWREAVHLVQQGVVSVADVDSIVSSGPGIRWGIMGPNLLFHLGGGQGGMQHFLDHLAGPFVSWWSELGNPTLTPALKQTLIEGVMEEADGRSVEELAELRDTELLRVLAIRDGE